MDDMNLTAGVTLALLIQYFIFSLFVGAARYKTGIKAPATTGDPFFEATFSEPSVSLIGPCPCFLRDLHRLADAEGRHAKVSMRFRGLLR